MQKNPVKPTTAGTSISDRQRSWRKSALWDKFKSLLGFRPMNKDKKIRSRGLDGTEKDI